MPNWTRRDFLKSGIAASASAKTILPGAGGGLPAQVEELSATTDQSTSAYRSPRERLLLDCGYGRDQEYAKTGDFFMWQRQGRSWQAGEPGPSALSRFLKASSRARGQGRPGVLCKLTSIRIPSESLVANIKCQCLRHRASGIHPGLEQRRGGACPTLVAFRAAIKGTASRPPYITFGCLRIWGIA